MRARFCFRFLLPMLAVCLGVACNEGIAGERQAVVVTITAEAPGYGAYQVDDMVTTPIAFTLSGMPGVQRIRSRATVGRAVVWVEFALGTDVYKARQATAERLQLAAPELPNAVVPRLAPVLIPDEIMLVALWVAGKAPEEDARRATELRELADRVVRRRLLAIPGVDQVVVTGGLVGQCQVVVSQEKTAQRALTISEVVSATEKTLAEDTARPGNQETLVVRGALTVDDLGEIVLAVREGNVIRLKDVAELRLSAVPPHRAPSRPKGEAKLPPQSAVLLGVLRQPASDVKGLLGALRQPESDAKRLSRELNVALEELRPTLPPGLSLGRQFPPELAPLASQMAEEIQQDQPPEVMFRQETSADFGTVLVRKSAPRTNIVIFGPDREHLGSAGRDLADRLRKVPGVADVQADSLEEAPQTWINVDRQRAARLGVPMSDILATVEVAHEGRKVGRLKDPRTGRAVDVVVTCGRDIRNDAESLQKLSLTTATREAVALGQLAKVEVVSVELAGQKVEGLEGAELTLSGGKKTFKLPSGSVEKGTYSLDPATNPRQIDATTDGREGIEKGIYALESDTLKLCLSTQGGARPKEFATRNGTDLILIVLKPGSATRADRSPDVADQADKPTGTRRFRMGFTGFVYDITPEAVIASRKFVRENGDILAHHIEGVPWAEALSGQPFPKVLLEEWEGKKSATPPRGQVYLAISPGRGDLKVADKAGPLPKELIGKAYDDPLVMKAYLNYCRRAVEFFKPDYLAIGIEVNEIYRDGGPKKWDAYVALHQHIYNELKKDHKDLPIFASWTLHQMFQQRGRMLEEFRKLMPHNDLVAVSYYPFFVADKDRLAALDWMTAQFDPFKKPYAMVETNDAAERLPLPKARVVIAGTPEKQAAYYRKLLALAQERDFVFVISFIHQDYDALWKKIANVSPELFIAWRDCGLLDENGRPRPAYAVWKEYFRLPKRD